MQMLKHSRHEEIFVIKRPGGERFIYAPLRKRLVSVNDDAVSIVAEYCSGAVFDEGSPEAEIIERLVRTGILGGEQPVLPTHPEAYPFRPHEVTLFLTSRCNLRCLYCYADAGKKNIDMSWPVAKAAIDFVADNAGMLGNRSFAVGFHGGGEPTVAWELLVKCCEYAMQLADRKGLSVELYAATNGVLNPEQREYIGRHFSTVNVSLDGPQDIQDTNRPRQNGQGSYDTIRETLQYFDNLGFHYGLRSTVTARTVSRMTETAEHICSSFHPIYFHLEPSWYCGRCLSTQENPPEDNDFVEKFQRAKEIARKYDIDVHYSGARLDVLTSKFCGAPGDSFTVLPEGIVTSCYEVTECDDPRAEIFHYGEFDSGCGRFRFYDDRIDILQSLSVDNFSFCEDCFCRWHCAGDCIAKAFGKDGIMQHNGTARCEINRQLLSDELAMLAAAADPRRLVSEREEE
jgi:uncharacterized protein